MNRRCKYYCDVEDAEGTPTFTIRVDDEGHKEQLVFRGKSPRGNTLVKVQHADALRRTDGARLDAALSQLPL